MTKNNFREFAKTYLSNLRDLIEKIDLGATELFINELELARKSGNTVFIIGNGGSAATASHMANDLSHNPKNGATTSIRALSLSDNVPLLTAIGNDKGYENIFLDQLKVHFRPGDKLVAVSASGNSPNVIRAAEWMKSQGGKVIALVGFDGGRLKALSDIVIHVETPAGAYGLCEDIHMILDHLIYSWLRSIQHHHS